jgi:mono/diheme cytochrome c family protein
VKATLAAFALVMAAAMGARAQDGAPPGFTQGQADHGAEVYGERCASCHGPNLNDGQFAPSLKGARFRADWGGKSAGQLFSYMSANMPPGQAGVLAADDYADLLAFLLRAGGAQAGTKPLPADAAMPSGNLPK